MKIVLHANDLPKNIKIGNSVAIDTETMGLNPRRDRLCLIQLSFGDDICHLIQIFDKNKKPDNLIKILTNKKILKIFHFARFDVGILKHTFNIQIENIYCTKIASKLVRTFTDKHGLQDLCQELLGISISKNEQTFDSFLCPQYLFGKNRLKWNSSVSDKNNKNECCQPCLL